MEVFSRILHARIVHEKCIHIDVIGGYYAPLAIEMRLEVRTDFCKTYEFDIWCYDIVRMCMEHTSEENLQWAHTWGRWVFDRQLGLSVLWIDGIESLDIWGLQNFEVLYKIALFHLCGWRDVDLVNNTGCISSFNTFSHTHFTSISFQSRNSIIVYT